MKNTFKKNERLKRKRYFDALFSHGKSMKAFPIRVIFLEFNKTNFPDIEDLPLHSQVAFSVPKRRFKHAVDRNRIKRQMREVYRLNKDSLSNNYAVLFIYLDNKKNNYNQIEKAMLKIMGKIKN